MRGRPLRANLPVGRGGRFVSPVLSLLILSLPAVPPEVRPTFVPDWHLGERWEVWLEEEA